MTPPDSFVAAFGSGRGSGSPATLPPPDPLTELLSWLADETTQRSIEFEEFQRGLEERGFFLDFSDFRWFYDDCTKHACPLWRSSPASDGAELVGFLVVTEDRRIRVIGYDMFGQSRTV